MSDQEDILRLKLRKGDQNTFQAIFESYYNQLINYATTITKDTEISREIVQEVFLKLWENREKNLIRGSIKAYLFTATNHQALNWLRHEKVKLAYQKEQLKDILPGIELPQTISPFLSEAIRHAIQNLPKKALEVFTKTQIEGLPQQEVADSMGISVKTVENQLRRSRKILQKKLKKFR